MSSPAASPSPSPCRLLPPHWCSSSATTVQSSNAIHSRPAGCVCGVGRVQVALPRWVASGGRGHTSFSDQENPRWILNGQRQVSVFSHFMGSMVSTARDAVENLLPSWPKGRVVLKRPRSLSWHLRPFPTNISSLVTNTALSFC